MKLLMETYTLLTKNLQDLNQEIQQRHSSMHLCTEQETRNLVKSLEDLEEKVQNLRTVSSIICHHLELLRIKCNEQLDEVSSKD